MDERNIWPSVTIVALIAGAVTALLYTSRGRHAPMPKRWTTSAAHFSSCAERFKGKPRCRAGYRRRHRGCSGCVDLDRQDRAPPGAARYALSSGAESARARSDPRRADDTQRVRFRNDPRKWNDPSRRRRNSRGLSAAGSGHSGRLDGFHVCLTAGPASRCWLARAIGTARRCESTIPSSTPGEFCGAIPTNFFTQQIARQQGQDIVQTGPDPRRFDAMGLQ